MFDFYDIIGNLGKGQFGLVQLAKHRTTGENVAVKIMNKENMTIN